MTHFAKVENGIVTDVIVIEQDVLNTGLWGDPSLWIQTSYNTYGGIHYAPNSWTPDGGIALRYNFAQPGYTYDSVKDAFIPPQPDSTWILNPTTCLWEPPS